MMRPSVQFGFACIALAALIFLLWLGHEVRHTDALPLLEREEDE